MTYRLLSIALAASLVALPPVAAASRKPGKGDLSTNLARVSAFCEQAILRAPGKGFPLPSLRGIEIHGGDPRDPGVPDLVKRFAARQQMAQLVSSPTFNMRFRAPDGDAWALVYEALPACDVMVTGASGDMPAAAVRLAESLGGDGWEVAGFIPATASRPLSKHILVKKLPKPGSPDFGIMLTVRALAGDSADPTGVQMEMGFLAGAVSNPPGSSDVKVEVNIPAITGAAPKPK
jgi:hypothetical protein